jgi:hypothetical protein
MERDRRRLVEYALVTAFLAIAAAGAVALFGDELRAALGIGAPGAPVAQSPAK